MNFQVELQVLLSAKAHRDPIGMSRIVELPFPPFPGLALFGLMEDPEEPVIVAEVAYSVIDRAFSCELEEDVYCPEDEEEVAVLTIGDKIAEYGDQWEVNEPGEPPVQGTKLNRQPAVASSNVADDYPGRMAVQLEVDCCGRRDCHGQETEKYPGEARHPQGGRLHRQPDPGTRRPRRDARLARVLLHGRRRRLDAGPGGPVGALCLAMAGSPQSVRILEKLHLVWYFDGSASKIGDNMLVNAARMKEVFSEIWVMNTDNMAISGETIDYGPCAFMNAYDPGTVFSSIDHAGRYAYGNQPAVAQWNLARFAEALLLLQEPDQKKAVALASEALGEFPALFERHWLEGMREKLSLQTGEAGDSDLIRALLDWMQKSRADFTNTFRDLSSEGPPFVHWPRSASARRVRMRYVRRAQRVNAIPR